MYTDYLLSTFGYETVTGLSRIVEGQGAHDQIARLLTAEGFNLLNCLYHVKGITLPIAFELIKKPIECFDLKTRKCKRASL